MQKKRFIILTAALLVMTMMAATAMAQEPLDVAVSAPGSGNAPITSENAPEFLNTDLQNAEANFMNFARTKVSEINRNIAMGKSKMQITRMPNGNYRGRYKALDHTTMKVNVVETGIPALPYSGAIHVYEMTYEGIAASREDLPRAQFRPIKKKFSPHIFGYSNGRWQ